MPRGEEEGSPCFVDSNVWLYAFLVSDSTSRHERAKSLIDHPHIVISTQVVNETCINLLRKARMPEATIRQLIVAFYERYDVVDMDRSILLIASGLREKYNLTYWDSLIVSSALRAGCEVLYTEDLQDGLEVEDQLVIINPFKEETS